MAGVGAVVVPEGAVAGPGEAVEVGQAEVGAAGRVAVEVGSEEVEELAVGAAGRVVVEVGRVEVGRVEVGQAEVAAARGVAAAALPVAWEVLTGIIPAPLLSATTRWLLNRILIARRPASRP
jgi:hypothetical protein